MGVAETGVATLTSLVQVYFGCKKLVSKSDVDVLLTMLLAQHMIGDENDALDILPVSPPPSLMN